MRLHCLRSAKSDTRGAPSAYVTTKEFLLEFGFDTLRDLPDFEALEDAGLLSKEKLLADDIPVALADDDNGESESAVGYSEEALLDEASSD